MQRRTIWAISKLPRKNDPGFFALRASLKIRTHEAQGLEMAVNERSNRTAPNAMRGFPSIQEYFSNAFLLQLCELRLREKKERKYSSSHSNHNSSCSRGRDSCLGSRHSAVEFEYGCVPKGLYLKVWSWGDTLGECHKPFKGETCGRRLHLRGRRPWNGLWILACLLTSWLEKWPLTPLCVSVIRLPSHNTMPLNFQMRREENVGFIN